MRVPDCPGPILGWRVWRVSDQDDGRLRLRSALHDEFWPAGRELLAGCHRGHHAPDEECACGIHAARDPESARCYLVGRDDPCDVHRVIGQVALWGWVLAGDLGWRASRAYPARIWVPARPRDGSGASIEDLVDALSAYRIPLEPVR